MAYSSIVSGRRARGRHTWTTRWQAGGIVAHGGQAVLDREIGELAEMTNERAVAMDEERVRPRLDHCPERRPELLGRSRADDLQLDTERRRRLLEGLDPGEGGQVSRIPEEGDSPRGRGRLLESSRVA